MERFRNNRVLRIRRRIAEALVQRAVKNLKPHPDKNMHLCMIVPCYWPSIIGGAENQCRKLTRRLSQKEITCTVLTPRLRFRHSRLQEDHGTLIIRTSPFHILVSLVARLQRLLRGTNLSEKDVFSFLLIWLSALSFMAGSFWHLFLKRRQINVIHVHTTGWIAGYAGWLGHKLAIPVICKETTLFPVFCPIGKEIPFSRLCRKWRHRTFYIAMTDAIVNELKKHDIEENKIFLVPNGVEIPAEQSDVRTNRTVVCVANLTQGGPRKAFDILIEAWSRVHKSEPDARVIIAGYGDAQPWKSYATKLGCGDSIDFPGYVEDISTVFKKAAVFLLVSKIEGISNALLESQSWGIPAVVSNIPGNLTVVEDGVNGFVVPQDDVQATASTILKLLADGGLRVTIGKAARERMKKSFSMDQVADKTIETYQKITAI